MRIRITFHSTGNTPAVVEITQVTNVRAVNDTAVMINERYKLVMGGEITSVKYRNLHKEWKKMFINEETRYYG